LVGICTRDTDIDRFQSGLEYPWGWIECIFAATGTPSDYRALGPALGRLAFR